MFLGLQVLSVLCEFHWKIIVTDRDSTPKKNISFDSLSLVFYHLIFLVSSLGENVKALDHTKLQFLRFHCSSFAVK